MLLAVALAASTLPVTALTANAATTVTPTTCTGTPVFVTATCVDPTLNQPYIDQDQPGSTTDPTTKVTVHYRYIHGGFTGTAARFAFYFPAKSAYHGRFFEDTYPLVTDESLTTACTQQGGGVLNGGITPCEIAFGLSNGAYVIVTNNAGGVPAGGDLAPYRANAAAAKYSRVVAAQVYGSISRPRGYLAGASGGAYQTVGSMENTDGVWDGAVPMVLGANNAIPSFMSVDALVQRVLGDKAAQIADAVAPGGSGRPFAGLTAEQRSVLAEASRLDRPLRSWWSYGTSDAYQGLSSFAGTVAAIDPTYVTDFWTQPGYEGADPSVQAARIQYDATVTSAAGNSVVVNSVPAGNLEGANLVITSGPLNGQSATILSTSGTTLQLDNNPGITAGTTVRIDNSWLVALEYYQRHQVPTPDEYGWNQYRDSSGQPSEPQRGGTCTTPAGSSACLLLGPLFASATAGSVPNGHFHGKMIMIGSVMDGTSWSADWYRQQAAAATPDINKSFRLWYVDNSNHDPNGPAVYPQSVKPYDHIVQYLGVQQQALLDLDAWVTHGTPPPATTSYGVDSLDQIKLPASAAQRRGVQPVVNLSADAKGHHGGQRLDIPAGRSVTFTVDAAVPPEAGKIVNVEWDFLGANSFTTRSPLHSASPQVHLQETYTFTHPGTYFPVVRVTSRKFGSVSGPYGLIQNLAAVRVVVH